MALDHGILNLPLSKRGNIDRDLDRYKAEQARIAKDKRQEVSAKFKEDKALAKVALVEILAAPGLVEQKAAQHNGTRSEMVSMLNDWAKWRPTFLIRVHADWLPKVAP